MKKNLICFVLLFVFALGGFGICKLNTKNYVSALEAESVVSSQELFINLIENDSVIEIVGHYYEKENCQRLTYVLTSLYLFEKKELHQGYAKYNYTPELYSCLNNISNENYSVWSSAEFLNYKATVNDADLLFWGKTDTVMFVDDFGVPYYFGASQYTDSQRENDASLTPEKVDRYGNYTYDLAGGTWIMPVPTKTNTLSTSDVQMQAGNLVAGNLDIDVEKTETGWRIVNKGNLGCRVTCLKGVNASSELTGLDGTKQTVDQTKYPQYVNSSYLYFDYPQGREYNLKPAIDIENAQDTTLQVAFEIKLSNQTFFGREFIVQDGMVGLKNVDETKIVAYFTKSSGKEEGWYLGVKTATQLATYSLTASTQSVIDDYSFTKLNDAPVVNVYDDLSSNFSKFMLKNSNGVPQTGLVNSSEILIILTLFCTVLFVSCLAFNYNKKRKDLRK